jgi:two-component system, LytTR family, response regulator
VSRRRAATWRVVIADDEPLAREVIRDLLEPAGDMTVVAECRTGVEVVEAVRAHQPDLLFLDVAMPDLDGLAALASLGADAIPATVLVTAFEEYALEAFDRAALDYLVKPFTDERFRIAVDRARRRLAERAASGPGYRARFLATVGRREVPVPVATVRWIEARSYYARLHVDGGRTHLIRRSLGTLERELDPACFVRVHRGVIVGLDHVTELRQDATGRTELILSGGERVPVSERRRALVRERLGRRQRG